MSICLTLLGHTDTTTRNDWTYRNVLREGQNEREERQGWGGDEGGRERRRAIAGVTLSSLLINNGEREKGRERNAAFPLF